MIRSCPGRSLRRSRNSFGMTTWNLGETFTVCIGVSYENHIDTVFVCQDLYRSVYRITIARLHHRATIRLMIHLSERCRSAVSPNLENTGFRDGPST